MKKYSAKYLSYVKKFIGYTILFLMVFIPPFMVFRETGFIGGIGNVQYMCIDYAYISFCNMVDIV